MADELKLKLILTAKDGLSGIIKQATRASDKEFERLQCSLDKTAQKFDNFGSKALKIGAGISASGLGLAHIFKLTSAPSELIQLEKNLRELGNVGDLTEKQLSNLEKQIRKISSATNNANADIIEGMNVLVAAGMNPDKAINYMQAIGKTATSQNAAITDIAKTTFAVADNLKVPEQEIQNALNILTKSGKEGRFELKAMANEFPSITAGAAMLGMKGTKAVASLGAAMQIAMKGAGSESEAATNVERFIGGLTSPLVLKNFEETFGSSLKTIIQNSAKNGTDPILDVLEVVKAKSNGDMFKVSEVFRDKTMQDFIKPMLQNLDEYKRIKASVADGKDAIDSDFQKMMSTTANLWKNISISMTNIAFEKLEKPLKSINKVLSIINSSDIAKKGLFNVIFGTISVGATITGLGIASKSISAMIKGFSGMLTVIREADIFLWSLGLNKSIPIHLNFSKTLKTVNTGILKLFPNLKKSTFAVNFFNLAMKGLNTTMYLNPVGVIIEALVAGAFLVWKYWKPIKVLFRGFFNGLGEGFKPLMPLFKKVATTLKPISTWLGRIFGQVETKGNRVENFGYRIGKGIADAVTWCIKLASKLQNLITLGGKIKIGSLKNATANPKNRQVDGTHFFGLNNVPYDGYIASLHKGERVLTADENKIYKNNTTGKININYNPNVVINSSASDTANNFVDILKRHKNELLTLLEQAQNRRLARAYV